MCLDSFCVFFSLLLGFCGFLYGVARKKGDAHRILIFPSIQGLGMTAVNYVLDWVYMFFEVGRVAFAPCSYTAHLIFSAKRFYVLRVLESIMHGLYASY